MLSPQSFISSCHCWRGDISLTLCVCLSTLSRDLSDCQAASSHPFPLWEWTIPLVFTIHLHTSIKRNKSWLKLVDFQHYFICFKLKPGFIIINLWNDYYMLNSLYPLVYLIMTILYTVMPVIYPFQRWRYWSWGKLMPFLGSHSSFKLIQGEAHDFKDEKVDELGWREDDRMVYILVI